VKGIVFFRASYGLGSGWLIYPYTSKSHHIPPLAGHFTRTVKLIPAGSKKPWKLPPFFSAWPFKV
jgi:hypothetical protein